VSHSTETGGGALAFEGAHGECALITSRGQSPQRGFTPGPSPFAHTLPLYSTDRRKADKAKSFTSSRLILHYRRPCSKGASLTWISRFTITFVDYPTTASTFCVKKRSYIHKVSSARPTQCIVSKACYAQTRNPAIANRSPVHRYTSILSWCNLYCQGNLFVKIFNSHTY